MQLGKYRHYSGKEYEVIALSKDSDTYEDYVVYQAQYNSPEFGDRFIRVKKKELFEMMVEVDGKEVKRFTYEGE
jgi:hypothetical protein